MNRTRKLIITFITLAPVLVILLISMFYILGQYRRLVDNAEQIFAYELSRRFEREVKIRDAQVTPLGSIILKGVRIAADKELKKGAMLDAKEIRVKYGWRDLLFRSKGAQSVTSVTVVDPSIVLVRRANGKFNIQDLLKPPIGKPGPPFLGTVRIVNGHVIFHDYYVARPRGAVTADLRDVQALIDAAGSPRYSFTGMAKSDRQRFTTARFVGRYDSNSKSVQIDVNAKNVNAPFIAHYIPMPKNVEVIAGNLDIIAGIGFERSGTRSRTLVKGTMEVSNGRLVVPKVDEPVTSISGRVVLLEQRAFVSLRGFVAGSTVDMTGTISDFEKLSLNLALRTPSVDFGRLVRTIEFLGGVVSLNPQGVGPLQTRITGTLRQPIVDLSANIPQVTVQGYTARNVALSGTYQPGSFNIARTQFRLFGGEFTASGAISLAGVPSLSVVGSVSGVSLTALPLPRDVRANGELTGSFNITGTVKNPLVTVSGSIPGGTINDVRFGSATGRFAYRSGQVQVSQLEIRQIEGGTVRVAGNVTLGRLDLAVEARGVQVQRFAEILGQPDLRGIVFFNGRIRGRPEAPAVTGDLEVFQASVRNIGIDYAKVTLTGEGKTIRVSGAVVRILPGEVKFDGTLTFLTSGRIAFDGHAQISRLTVDKVASILGLEDVPAGGIIEGDLMVSGIYVPGAKTLDQSLVNTVASGTIRVEDATAFGYPLRTAVADFTLRDNVLTIDRAQIASQDAETNLEGNVNLLTRLIDMRFALTNFYLSRLGDFLGSYATVGGTLNASGTIQGPIDDARIAVQANVNDLVVNNQQYGQAQLNLAYEKGLVDSLTLTFAQNGQPKLTLSADDYDPQANCVASAQAKMDVVSIPLLWSVIMDSPYIRSERGKDLREKLQELPTVSGGTLNGTVTLTGCLDELNGAVDLTASNLALDSGHVQSVAVNAAIAQGIVTLNQFQAVSDETVLTATGTLSIADRQIGLDINAQNFDLARLRPWLGGNTPSGTLAAEFVVQGDVTSPFIKGSVEVVNPAFGGVQFDRFRISTVEIQRNKIDVSDAILAAGSYQIVAQGILPWSWSTLSIPADEPISFSASMKQQDLSILASFIPRVVAARTSGPINASLQIGGTLSNPNLSGGVTITGGTLAVENLENTFQNIGVDLAFAGNRIVFSQLSADSSLGGTIQVVPGGVIDIAGRGAGQVDLRIRANAFLIAERNLLGFKEDVRTQIDAGLSVTGNLSSPLVTDATIQGVPAGIRLSNAKFTFVIPKALTKPERAPLGVNPRFNVSLIVGPNVLISPPNISLSVVDRQGSLTGTLSDPVLNLTLEVLEGSLRLAGRRLRVEPGGEIVVHYSPPQNPEVRFNFDAVTNVSATTPLGGRERYEIVLHVGGRLENLQIDLESSPPGLSREQMLAALGHVEGIFTSGASQLQEELVNVLGAIGTQTIFAPIETLFVNKFGFETFTLEYQPGSPLAIYASSRLFGNYYVSAYWKLTSDFAATNPAVWQFIFSYRFKRIYSFSIGIDDQQTLIIGAGYTNSISL